MEIKSVEELVEPHLENGERIVSYDYKSLLPPGENYGSVMLALNIKVRNKFNEEKIIQCVAKAVPSSDAVWEFFNISLTFKKEIAFYNTIVPLLNDFGKENGINNFMEGFAKCLGARISLDPESNVVDKNAIFVLENLRVQGYEVGDRFTGFNLETSKLILSNLANLHAGAIALKLCKPSTFETLLRPHLSKGMLFVAPDKMLNSIAKNIEKFASKNPKCVPLLSRIENGVRKMRTIWTYDKIREPFATIMHNDLWTNNIMIKFQDNKPTSVKFLDFAVNEYSSPARDVLFFLYSSVNLDVIQTQIDELIKFYYDKMINTLKKLKCNVSTFLFDEFREEIDEVAKDTEFAHIMYMCTPIFTLNNAVKDINEWTPDDLAPQEDSIHENYSQRLQFTILDFAKRNWI